MLHHHSGTHLIVELTADAKKSDLENSGFKIIRTLQPDVFIVKSPQIPVEDFPHVIRQALSVNHLWKLQDGLDFVNKSSDLIFIKCDPCNDVLRIAQRYSKSVESSGLNQLLVKGMPGESIEQIVALESVVYVGIESLKPIEESRVLDLNLGPNKVNVVHNDFPSLNGKGMALGIKELLFDKNDFDLHGRAIDSDLASSELSMHATEMATIAAGAGNTFLTGLGVAWDASIASSSFDNLVPDPSDKLDEINVYAQNHSYGTSIENFYGMLAESYDKALNDDPTMLHIFSSGNSGLSSPGEGAYEGLTGTATLTGNFKQAKNVIVVGAVDTTGAALAFGSKGPAYDGRVKPEVVAYSTHGTSNAAALVTGVSVLLQQAYKEKHGQLPSSALIKSVLINSAEDVGLPEIDYETGYGNVNAIEALNHINEDRYFEGNVNHTGTLDFPIEITSNVKRLKLTLVWNDPAASPNSNQALVNDLDLSLAGVGDSYLPWILNPAPGFLDHPPVRGADHLNNVEKITVENPLAGSYTLSVSGFDVPEGPQQFFVAFQMEMNDEFEWYYPKGKDNFPYNGETTSYFYWRNTYDGSGALDYSTDNGMSWQLISDNIDLTKEQIRWINAPQLNTTAIARMTIDGRSFLSESFTISAPISIRTGFDCADSVMLKWDRVAEASSYEVYENEIPFKQKILETEDTFLIFKKHEFPTGYFSVRPVLPENASLIGSALTDFASLGTACFINSFFDALQQDGIRLFLTLGTTYMVESIFLEREGDNGFEHLAKFDFSPTGFFEHLDNDPREGFNRYRARLVLANGEEVVSETVENFFVTKVPFFLFPNPVKAHEDLRIFSKTSESQSLRFSLYKIDGSLLFTSDYASDREFISIDGLMPGVYLYTVYGSSGSGSGKLIVLP